MVVYEVDHSHGVHEQQEALQKKAAQVGEEDAFDTQDTSVLVYFVQIVKRNRNCLLL